MLVREIAPMLSVGVESRFQLQFIKRFAVNVIMIYLRNIASIFSEYI
jgi:hypothetical protein